MIDHIASEQWAEALQDQHVRFAWVDVGAQSARIETTDKDGMENKVYIFVENGELRIEY